MRSNTLTSFAAFALVALSSTVRVLADNPINAGFPYGSTKVRGVNLGGWLVLEVNITYKRRPAMVLIVRPAS